MRNKHREVESVPLSEKLRRGDVLIKECPSRGILQDVTGRWGILVLLSLLDGTYRFSQLRKKITGVSEKMLAQTLQALEADGFVLRIAYPIIPPHVEYQLTDNGIEIAKHLETLVDWIEVNLGDILKSKTQYIANK